MTFVRPAVALLFVLITSYLFATSGDGHLTYSGTDVEKFEVHNVLRDQGYTIDQIVSDTSLQYLPTNTPGILENGIFWVRFYIKNESAYAQRVFVRTWPYDDNLLYAYNLDTKRWEAQRYGMRVQRDRVAGGWLVLPPQRESVFYLRADLTALDITNIGRFVVLVFNGDNFIEREQAIRLVWIAGLCVFAVLFLYNAYVYILFRDPTFIFYLGILIGVSIYATAVNGLFKTFLNWYPIILTPSGSGFMSYESDNFFMDFGICVLMWSVAGFTRSYLNTTQLAPKWDQVLKYYAIFFCSVVMACNALTLSTGSHAAFYIVEYYNVGIVIGVVLNFSVAVILLKKSRKTSVYYLAAHTIPLLMMIFMAVYSNMVNCYPFCGIWYQSIPNVGGAITGVTLAIAVVARVQILKDENHKQALQLVEERAQREQLQQKLDYNSRELASTTVHMYQKNEMLKKLQDEIRAVKAGQEMKTVNEMIQRNLDLDADWEKFKLHFEQVNPNFFEELKVKYPALTNYEQRLFAYFHMNLSSKEIATLLNIDPSSVRKAKMRMNKKISAKASEEDYHKER